MDSKQYMTGAEALMESLIFHNVDTIFGYPGGQIVPVYDKLYNYTDRIRHILVRHEQGAIHAAQGYARVSGRTGVVVVTSGPGATNVVTGVADAMVDSTPVVVITGQVASGSLGTDAFQEADIIGLTTPITKWNYQIRRPEDVSWAVARAFYIAGSGRPGPVVLDITMDAQVGLAEYKPANCDFIRSYVPERPLDMAGIESAAALIDASSRPLLVFGQGITLSGASEQLASFLEKGDIPAASTLLGLSALPSDFPLYQGMVGMHGNIAPNVKTNECDVLIAVGMRFDSRVTGKVKDYAPQAKVIHIDIDPAETGKIIHADVGIVADAAKALEALTSRIGKLSHKEWIDSFAACRKIEEDKVFGPELHSGGKHIHMGEVVRMVSEVTEGKAVVVTDVGQNQMMAARYSQFATPGSMVTSGGLGTMGFGIPAAIGAKIAVKDRPVCLFAGDGGIQMTIQEWGTARQENVGVKMVILNNNWLGNVRQWQELFYGARYSFTRMLNPDYAKVAEGYGIKYRLLSDRADLEDAVRDMFSDDEPYILEVRVEEEANVFPMIPAGKNINQIMLNAGEWY